MKTSRPQPRLTFCSPSATLVLMIGLTAASVWATPITGDTVTGDLTVDGDTITIENSTDQFELRLGTDQIDFWQDTVGTWVWSHGASPNWVMSLNINNNLSLYDLGASSVNPSITLIPGNPDANPAIGPSILIGDSEVLTVSSALSMGFINTGNFGAEISSYLLDNSLSLSGGSASGNSSIAMSGGTAHIDGSTAMSYGQAYGHSATAMSYGNAFGECSTAMTSGSAYGDYSTAMTGGVANGFWSTAMTSGSANSSFSTAMSFAIANGIYSTAMSLGDANGEYSTAMTNGTTYGISSTAMSTGFAYGENSTAMSQGWAVGGYSTAMSYGGAYGENSTATTSASAFGSTSTAMSYGYAWGDASTAMCGTAYGEGATAISGGMAFGFYSTAMSSGTANGNYSTAMSYGTTNGDFSTAFAGGTALGEYSFASGEYTAAASFSSTAIGSHNYSWGSVYSWVETDPILTVGNGNADVEGSPSNAITTLKNGQSTLSNKSWRLRDAVTVSATADPDPNTTDDSDGVALVVEGHTVMKGKVTIAAPQGDISMGDYQ